MDRNVLFVFFGGIGVVHAHVADATKHARDGKIEGDGLGVAQMQVPVGFGGKRVLTNVGFVAVAVAVVAGFCLLGSALFSSSSTCNRPCGVMDV